MRKKDENWLALLCDGYTCLLARIIVPEELFMELTNRLVLVSSSSVH